MESYGIASVSLAKCVTLPVSGLLSWPGDLLSGDGAQDPGTSSHKHRLHIRIYKPFIVFSLSTLSTGRGEIFSMLSILSQSSEVVLGLCGAALKWRVQHIRCNPTPPPGHRATFWAILGGWGTTGLCPPCLTSHCAFCLTIYFYLSIFFLLFGPTFKNSLGLQLLLSA